MHSDALTHTHAQLNLITEKCLTKKKQEGSAAARLRKRRKILASVLVLM
jgi:hypothetical protein